jgi:hypothetical protein
VGRNAKKKKIGLSQKACLRRLHRAQSLCSWWTRDLIDEVLDNVECETQF